jgi:hypothetical protein
MYLFLDPNSQTSYPEYPPSPPALPSHLKNATSFSLSNKSNKSLFPRSYDAPPLLSVRFIPITIILTPLSHLRARRLTSQKLQNYWVYVSCLLTSLKSSHQHYLFPERRTKSPQSATTNRSFTAAEICRPKFPLLYTCLPNALIAILPIQLALIFIYCLCESHIK